MNAVRAAVMLLAIVLAGGCATSAERPAEVGDLAGLVAQADAAYRAGHIDVALATYRTLTDRVPAEPTFWARRGHLHFAAGQRDDAVAAYQRALLLVPGYPEVLRNLATLHLGRAADYLQQALAGEALTAGERDALLAYLSAVSAAREVARDGR